MLIKGLLRGEPTFARYAGRALHHLHEAQPELCLTIAPATVGNNPVFSRAFNKGRVDFSHPFDDESVDIEIQAHFGRRQQGGAPGRWRCSTFVDGYLRRPVLTPLHRTLSPTSGGIFVLMFVSCRKPLEIQCSTISVVAGICRGINGSDGGASPPWSPEALQGC